MSIVIIFQQKLACAKLFIFTVVHLDHLSFILKVKE
jgi:hypothetical protein